MNTGSAFYYDALGNISIKSDVGSYSYNPSGLNSIRPHAVSQITGTVNGVVNPTFTYDANGNMVSGAGRSVTWSSFNIPSQITNQTPAGIKTAAFWYNPEHERIKELQADQSIVITLSPRYDTGLHFEKKYITTNGVLTGAVEYEHYLYAGGLMFGKFITNTATDGVTLTSSSIEYYSKDHLGSIVAITDGTGVVTQRLSYDVWGKRRYPNGAADPNGLLNNPDMYHGFTGHEMLDAVGLIHMNGRLYDPVMGRFVSADFMIQSPDNLQSYNRYSYGGNNPLGGADPSGQSFWTSFRDSVIRAVAAVADANGCGGYCSAAVGAYQGQRNGGGLTGAVVGGIRAYVGYQASVNYPLNGEGGSILWQNVATAAMINAATGCAGAAATGGSCGQAALSGAMGTVGSAFGLTGSLVAGCAAGRIGSGSCSKGAIDAIGAYTGSWAGASAARYIIAAQQTDYARTSGQQSAKSPGDLAANAQRVKVLIVATGNTEWIDKVDKVSISFSQQSPADENGNLVSARAIGDSITIYKPTATYSDYGQLFVMAHEYAHVLLKETVSFIEVLPFIGNNVLNKEAAADQFAIRLLKIPANQPLPSEANYYFLNASDSQRKTYYQGRKP